MNSEIKKFVEEYNKRMSWNRDIIKNLKIKYSKLNKYLQRFVDENLSTKDITEEGFDLERAKVYSYEDGTLELQAFNNETYGTTYFWVKPVETEELYKKNRILQIIKELDKEIDDRQMKLKDVLAEFKAINSFRKLFN